MAIGFSDLNKKSKLGAHRSKLAKATSDSAKTEITKPWSSSPIVAAPIKNKTASRNAEPITIEYPVASLAESCFWLTAPDLQGSLFGRLQQTLIEIEGSWSERYRDFLQSLGLKADRLT